MPGLSTHVLDATRGGPLAGVAVVLTTSAGRTAAAGTTDAAGRISDLAADLAPGRYRLTWTLPGADRVFPVVSVDVDLAADRHYHVPVLASPASAVVYLGA